MDSPLLKQYHSIKQRYPDALLLFRVNDYYECFDNDAEIVANLLELTLTVNKDKVKLSGFSYPMIDQFLPKLVKAGYRVAICDQLSHLKQTHNEISRTV